MITKAHKLNIQQMNASRLNDEFLSACKMGNLELVKFFLTGDVKEQIDIDMSDGSSLSFACENGHTDVIKYLLTSPDILRHAQLTPENFKNVCINEDINLIEYFLSSPELKTHADIHWNNDYAFKRALLYENDILVNYYIFTKKISFTKAIEMATINKPDILKLFSNRDLYEHIESTLSTKEQEQTHKIKI